MEVEVSEEDVVGCHDGVGSDEISKVVAEFCLEAWRLVGDGSFEGGVAVRSDLEV